MENNLFSPTHTHQFWQDLNHATEENHSVEEVFDKWQAISEEERAKLINDCDVNCRLTVERVLNRSDELADDYTNFVSALVSKLSPAQQQRFYELVTEENNLTREELAKQKTGKEKALDLAFEAALMLKKENGLSDAKVGFAKKKSDSSSSTNRNIAKPVFQTDSQAAKVAKELGYTRTNYRTKSDAVIFKKGNSYITRDVDGHNGGAWKEASSPEKLNKKETRNGTFDINLNRIGD
ncbi:toxin C-terminal domain-containing protein [Conservatibacter flavescens]|uniref:toxin C-terminal domain-containing protein n=1 Tax=Conservatibacter flavescens TaxID=28161 RepID=UPI0010548B26|nr:toxin C-terminal domain-containing protein [Conservatibacter flavescens]